MLRFRPVLTVCAAVGMAILIGLGTWQLQRRAWKLDLIEKVENRIDAEAMRFEGAAKLASDDQDAEYMPVYQTGVYRHDLEAHVFGTLEGQPGYYVFTPLDLPDFPWVEGTHVYVNRGFVPQTLKDPAVRADSLMEGEVTVRGLFRTPHAARGIAAAVAPADDPDANIWHRRDPKAFAAAAGISALEFYIDSSGDESSAEWPKGGTTRVDFSNRHLEYALTWYGLAGALFAVWLAFSLRRGK